MSMQKQFKRLELYDKNYKFLEADSSNWYYMDIYNNVYYLTGESMLCDQGHNERMKVSTQRDGGYIYCELCINKDESGYNITFCNKLENK